MAAGRSSSDVCWVIYDPRSSTNSLVDQNKKTIAPRTAFGMQVWSETPSSETPSIHDWWSRHTMFSLRSKQLHAMVLRAKAVPIRNRAYCCPELFCRLGGCFS